MPACPPSPLKACLLFRTSSRGGRASAAPAALCVCVGGAHVMLAFIILIAECLAPPYLLHPGKCLPSWHALGQVLVGLPPWEATDHCSQLDRHSMQVGLVGGGPWLAMTGVQPWPQRQPPTPPCLAWVRVSFSRTRTGRKLSGRRPQHGPGSGLAPMALAVLLASTGSGSQGWPRTVLPKRVP